MEDKKDRQKRLKHEYYLRKYPDRKRRRVPILQRERMRILIELAKSVPCVDCGGTFTPYCMDLDHRDPSEKVITIGKFKDHCSQLLIDELPKCDPVCVNCHRRRTYSRMLAEGKIRKTATDANTRFKNKIRKMVEDAKDCPCLDCGGSFHVFAMEFDHRDPSAKEFNLHKAACNGGVDRVKREMDKCDIVCANCHRTRTWNLKHYIPDGRVCA